MSEGLGETQARRFLSKLDIKPPDKKKKHFIGHRKTRANNWKISYEFDENSKVTQLILIRQ